MAKYRVKEPTSEQVRAKQGTSLVIVICIAALLMAFALSMLYTASLLLSRANRRLEQENSYQLARSFAQVLHVELTGRGYETKKPTEAPPKSFYSYACKFLDGTYGEYDPDYEDETIFHYTGADAVYTGASLDDQKKYGSIMVRLFKEANQEDEKMEGLISISDGSSYQETVKDIVSSKIHRYDFTVEVVAERDGVSYSYDTEYRQMVTYEAVFTDENGNQVYCSKETGDLHRGSAQGEIVTSGDIHYEYKTASGDILTCEFEKAY